MFRKNNRKVGQIFHILYYIIYFLFLSYNFFPLYGGSRGAESNMGLKGYRKVGKKSFSRFYHLKSGNEVKATGKGKSS